MWIYILLLVNKKFQTKMATSSGNSSNMSSHVICQILTNEVAIYQNLIWYILKKYTKPTKIVSLKIRGLLEESKAVIMI